MIDGDDVDFLDTGDSYSPVGWALQRLYSRTLYAYKSSATRRSRPPRCPTWRRSRPKISADGMTYTFTLRQGVKWGPPVNRVLVAQDFVYALGRHVRQEDPVERPAVRPADQGHEGVRRRQGQEQ